MVIEAYTMAVTVVLIWYLLMQCNLNRSIQVHVLERIQSKMLAEPWSAALIG